MAVLRTVFMCAAICALLCIVLFYFIHIFMVTLYVENFIAKIKNGHFNQLFRNQLLVPLVLANMCECVSLDDINFHRIEFIVVNMGKDRVPTNT